MKSTLTAGAARYWLLLELRSSLQLLLLLQSTPVLRLPLMVSLSGETMSTSEAINQPATTTATAIPFGTLGSWHQLLPSAQQLSVATNASYGFVVTVEL
jgi:hypothetical protein